MVTQDAGLATHPVPPPDQLIPQVTPLEPLRHVVDSLRAMRTDGRRELEPRRRQRLVAQARQAGAALLPALFRSLLAAQEAGSGDCPEADWACYLLRKLDEPAVRARVVERLQAMLVEPRLGDDFKARVLGLLADLGAPVPEQVVLQDPDALLERSVRELLADLAAPGALAQALDMIFTQVPGGELENFLFEVVQHGGAAASPLLAALVQDPRTPRPLAEQLTGWVRPAGEARRPPSPLDLPAVTGLRARRPRPHIGRALSLLESGRLELAHDELCRLHAQKKGDPAVSSALGLCLLRLGKPEGALAPLEQAARLAPTVAAHAWNLAVAAHLCERQALCYRALSDYLGCRDEQPGAAGRREAAADLTAQLERYVARAYPGRPLGQVLESEELFTAAVEAFRDARWDAAVAGFAGVLERLPAHPASWRNLGFAYLAQRRPRDAARCFSRLRRLDPGPRPLGLGVGSPDGHAADLLAPPQADQIL